MCPPYQGDPGPEPTPSELDRLGMESLREFIRQDQRRLSPGIPASGFVMTEPFDKAAWFHAALKLDEDLNSSTRAGRKGGGLGDTPTVTTSMGKW